MGIFLISLMSFISTSDDKGYYCSFRWIHGSGVSSDICKSMIMYKSVRYINLLFPLCRELLHLSCGTVDI